MQEIEFSKDLNEMNDAELRATLREFRTNYDDAKGDYDELQASVAEYKENLEEAESKAEIVDEIQPKFAAMFAEMKDLDEETVADKFTADELVEELEAADAFSLEIDTDEDVDEEPEDEENKFSDKEQKSEKVEDGSDFQDRIDRFMERRVISYDN